MTEFTPVLSATGGILIGLASVMLMAALGRIAGISGMIGGLLPPVTAGEWGWRLAFLAGMIAAPVVLLAATGSMPVIEVPSSTGMLVIGGILVGIGVSYGSGCTSGHGVCGISRLSPRGIVATLVYLGVGAATMLIARHLLGVI